MSEDVEKLAKEMSGKLGNIVGARVYMTITDQNGNFVFTDTAFNVHKDFIQNFVKSNFNYLNIGDHSIPLSNHNIIFFKTTESSIAVLYNPKGKIGQLLVFRKIMNDYTDMLNKTFHFADGVSLEIIGKIPEQIEIPEVEIRTPIISRKERLFSYLVPLFNEKIKIKDKFTFVESTILNKCDGKNNLTNLIKNNKAEPREIMDIIHKFCQKNLISFPNHEMLKVSCAECNMACYEFVPKYFADGNKEKIRFQLFPEDCDHACLVNFDKKDKILTKKLEKLMNLQNTVDLTNLTLTNLIAFFGQDMFFNIFHAIFFRIPIIFIGVDIETDIKQIVKFLIKIFPNLDYGTSISCITPEKYKKNTKTYQNHLIIDFDTNVVKEPYKEKEDFHFEFKLFKDVLKLENDNLQILRTNSEFERLILHTDRILGELAPIKEISEDDLIKKFKEEHDMIIERSEIPIIQKIAEIYYQVDIMKKIKRTVSGQLSSFFDIV